MPSGTTDYASVLSDLKKVRRAGMVRLRGLQLPALTAAAEAVGEDPSASEPQTLAVERLLRPAVSRPDSGNLREAAEYTLGLTPGTRDWPGADRSRRAAAVYSARAAAALPTSGPSTRSGRRSTRSSAAAPTSPST